MDRNDVVQLALDHIKGTVPATYTAEQSIESLRQAFIDANGGTKLTLKTFRDNPELYKIIEAIIPAIITKGFQGDEFFNALVDYRNIALGDDVDFWAEDDSLFVVSNAAYGTQGIRRQRLDVGQKVDIATTLKVIKVYDELNRLLAGRVDFNMFVERVAKSMAVSVYGDIYAALVGISASTVGLNSNYVKAGSFDEATLLTLIEHVEADTNKTARIVGSRAALRKVTSATIADEAKSDMYNAGYFGKFNGTDMVVAKQRHAVGSDTFLLAANKIWVIASDDKPIKVLDVGEGLMQEGDSLAKADMTKEYLYGQDIGTGVICSQKLGVYTIS